MSRYVGMVTWALLGDLGKNGPGPTGGRAGRGCWGHVHGEIAADALGLRSFGQRSVCRKMSRIRRGGGCLQVVIGKALGDMDRWAAPGCPWFPVSWWHPGLCSPSWLGPSSQEPGALS